MDEPKYFKAACVHCGNHIEFPETAVGRMVDCPHCGQRTQLRTLKIPAPADPESPEKPHPEEPQTEEQPALDARARSVSRFAPAIAAVGVLAALIGGFVFWKAHQSQASAQTVTSTKPKEQATNASASDSLPTRVLVAPTNLPPATNSPAAAAKSKEPADLKAGEIQLEKAGGSSLIYAVGQLDNNSDYQRFGVKIQLDVFNKAGKKLGTAQDYIQVLEPRKSWHFRALLTDSKAATARVASITEDQ
jgi:hypothetical protein